MADYRDENNSQSEEDLGRLEDSRDHEDERPRSKAADPRDLPRPLYRIKSTHSNETFYAYFPKSKAEPPAPAEPAAKAAEDEPLEGAAAEAGQAGDLPLEDPGAEDGPAEEGAAEGARGKGQEFRGRTMVVVPTRYGRDVCELQGVMENPGQVGKDEIVPIERIATEEDLRKVAANRERENKAFETCRQKIASRNLPMKLVSAHYLLEEPKVLFYFSAESRVDFRELVKDLVAVFKIRIELRQIGVRDEARVTGGCGVCGRVLCCHGVTDKLVPVSIKMAKDQNLSLNSMKISGPCGRLLCCLAYEYGFYRDARRELPAEGARFQYDGVLFRVIEVNALSGSVKMAGEDGRLLDMPAAGFAFSEGRWHVKEGAVPKEKEEEKGKSE
jgi:cell fate regulator YaaT (PSP1 superfamily)